MPANTISTIIDGNAISPGLGMGKAFIYTDVQLRRHAPNRIKNENVQKERQRIKEAFERVLEDLRRSEDMVATHLDEDFAGIFRSHREMLLDPSLREQIQTMIAGRRISAESAVRTVFDQLRSRLRQSGNGHTAERTHDIADLANRMLQILTGQKTHALSDLPQGTVVVAKQLLPSDTVHFSRRSVSAVVLERGGPTSHAAILTRELGIPAVSGIERVFDRISQDQSLLVDGMDGAVHIAPGEEKSKTFYRRACAMSLLRAEALKRADKAARTRDGLEIPVMANISCREDAQLAAQNGADGVGLYRIEHIYFGKDALPEEQELAQAIRETLAPLPGDMPITLRLLDTGGDKPLTFLDYPGEFAPLMGRRGVRFLLDYPRLLRTLLRSFLRIADERPIRILVPMVTLASDMQWVREAYERVASEMACRRPPPLGAMVETPAAALCTEEIAEYSDFFSAGTNDLTQYTMVAGRENAHVAKYFLQDHPAVYRLLDCMVRGASGKPVGACGELAGQIPALENMLRLGIRKISLTPLQIPHVKETIRQMDLSDPEEANHVQA